MGLMELPETHSLDPMWGTKGSITSTLQRMPIVIYEKLKKFKGNNFNHFEHMILVLLPLTLLAFLKVCTFTRKDVHDVQILAIVKALKYSCDATSPMTIFSMNAL